MKAVIQRVTAASVTVEDKLVSSISKGLCILIGISNDDDLSDVEYISRKVLSMRLFEEDGKRWMKSVKDMNYEILSISQFTLYHRLKGNKPDFHLAMSGDKAKDLYNDFLRKLGSQYNSEKIKDGKFGEYMQVHIQNDGPVTINIESPVKTKQNPCVEPQIE
ncbi:unnamed protein product [Diamesa tonsa]